MECQVNVKSQSELDIGGRETCFVNCVCCVLQLDIDTGDPRKAKEPFSTLVGLLDHLFVFIKTKLLRLCLIDDFENARRLLLTSPDWNTEDMMMMEKTLEGL